MSEATYFRIYLMQFNVFVHSSHILFHRVHSCIYDIVTTNIRTLSEFGYHFLPCFIERTVTGLDISTRSYLSDATELNRAALLIERFTAMNTILTHDEGATTARQAW